MNRAGWLGLSLLAATGGHQRAAAQTLEGKEYVAGAAVNVLLRGPYVSASWRRPMPRAALALAISATYEGVLDRHGWSWKDVTGRAAGYVLTEGLLYLITKELKRGTP